MLLRPQGVPRPHRRASLWTSSLCRRSSSRLTRTPSARPSTRTRGIDPRCTGWWRTWGRAWRGRRGSPMQRARCPRVREGAGDTVCSRCLKSHGVMSCHWQSLGSRHMPHVTASLPAAPPRSMRHSAPPHARPQWPAPGQVGPTRWDSRRRLASGALRTLGRLRGCRGSPSLSLSGHPCSRGWRRTSGTPARIES